MHVGATAGEQVDRNRRRAQRALCLGLLSPVLVILGFGWVPLGIELGILAGAAAVVEGVRALAPPRTTRFTVLAASGMILGLLVLTVVLYFFISFAINPPE